MNPTKSDSLLLSQQVEQIETLVIQQEIAENKRRAALAAAAAAHREIDLLQGDLLHTALRRNAELDDAIDDARMSLLHKQELLRGAEELLEEDENSEKNLRNQCEALEKQGFEQQTLLMDLQRRLLEAGVSSGSIAQLLQSEARGEKALEGLGTTPKSPGKGRKPARHRLIGGLFKRSNSSK